MASDDDVTPPLRRPPSIMGDDDRALSGAKQRRTPAKGVSLAPEVFEENSENYSGEDLRKFRESHELPDRVSRLEAKMDDVKGDVSEIKEDVKGMVASNANVVGTLQTFMTMQQAQAAQQTEQLHAAQETAQAAQQAAQSRTKTDSLMRVVKETATETTTATLATRVLDQQDASVKFRRKFVLSALKIVGIVAGSAGGGAVVHWLLEKL